MGLLDFLKGNDNPDEISPVVVTQQPVGAQAPLQSKLNGLLNSYGGAGNLGLQLLANSGYSTTPRSFGQIFGQSALNAQQLAAGQQERDLKDQLVRAQIQQLQQKPAVTPPASLQEYQYAKSQGFPGTFQEWQAQQKAPPGDVQEYEYAKKQGYTGSYEQWVKDKKTPADSTEIQGYKLAQSQGFKGTYLDYLQKKSAVTQVGEDLSPDDLNLAATVVMTDPSQMKQFASFGKAGQARRDQINTAITQKLKESGMTPSDLGNLRATFKAQGASINKLVPQLNAIEAYEQTAKFNGQRLLDLVDKIDNTGIPVIEGYARRAQKAVGDPDQAEFASVLQQYQTEAARIISNPNLTGVLSDSARQELQEVINGNMSAAQLKRVINRLNTEFEFRANAIRGQIGNAGQGMTNLGTGGNGLPSIPSTPITKGQTRVLNGVTYINLTGQPDGWHVQ